MSKNRLLASMDSLAKKRQKEFDEVTKWTNQIQYYKSWDSHNNKYQNWTSSECYKNSIDQYDAMKSSEKKKLSLENRREKLRKIFFEEDQENDLEIQYSPRYGRSNQHYKLNQTPTEVLKDVNLGLKLAEDDRRRHEAELKLYQQWKNENPIIRNYEVSQNTSDVKLAWLDQQIQKRMEQEQTEAEMKQLIEERDTRIKEEEILDKKELEEKNLKEKQLMSEIELQIKHFKLKEEEATFLKSQEDEVFKKKQEIEDLIQKNLQDLKLRKNKEIALFNINQSKLKLRKKAILIEENLKKEQQTIEELIASKTADEITSEEKRNEIKKSMFSFLNYVRSQQKLEEQRQKYISFIFDSEAKTLWEKQERQWIEEQQSRDQLLQEVLQGIQKQIEDKLQRNLQQQQFLLKEREEMLQNIEDHDKQMKVEMEKITQKRIERKLELDKQIDEKRCHDFEKKQEEDKKKRDELDRIRKEEDKLKHELMRMQTRQYPQTRFNRRILW